MSLQYDPNLTTAAAAAVAGAIPPLAIDREWCLGDSLFFLNRNIDVIDNRIVTLNTAVTTISSAAQAQTTQINSLTSEIIQGIPTGMVQTFARTSAPTGWLKCDGSVITTSGTVQGVNANLLNSLRQMLINDSSPFGVVGINPRIPDLRGEFVRGWADGGTVDSGRTFGSSQVDEFKEHQHFTTAIPSRYRLDPAGTTNNPHYGCNAAASIGSTWVGDTETRPRNVALLYCIKY